MVSRFPITTLGTLLPILVFAAAMIVLFDRQQQHAVEMTLRQSARAALDAVDSHMAARLATLLALAASPALQTEDLTSFRHHAERVLNQHSEWLTLQLSEGTAPRPVLELASSAAAAAIPEMPDPEEMTTVLQNGQPLIGRVQRHAGFTAEPFVSLHIPVRHNGAIRFVLSAALRATTVSEILRRQPLPESWTVAALDRTATIVGRTQAHQLFTGARATPSLVEHMDRTHEGFFFAWTQEGRRVYTLFTRSAFSGWTVAIGAPADLIEQPRHRSRLALTGGGLVAAVLAFILVRTLERRHTLERQLLALTTEQATERRLTAIAQTFPGLIFRRVQHPDGRISYPYLSDGLHALLGLELTAEIEPQREDVARMILAPEDIPLWLATLQTSAQTLEPFQLEVRLRDAKGQTLWMRSAAHPCREADGRVVWDGVLFDITDLKQSQAQLEARLAEKETLLREVHHRVKNNLQAIWGLIQTERAGLRDGQARERLEVISQRLNILGSIHQQLYQSPNLARIDFHAYLDQLCSRLLELHHRPDIHVTVTADRLSCDLEIALPLGLIAHELIGNAFKHAFPAGRGGLVTVGLQRREAQVELAVADNGIGVAPARGSGGLGLTLVQALVNQVGATVRVEHQGGTRVRILLSGEHFLE